MKKIMRYDCGIKSSDSTFSVEPWVAAQNISSESRRGTVKRVARWYVETWWGRWDEE